MQITIYNKDEYDKYFIYNYLPSYMLELVRDEYRYLKAAKLEKELGVNILGVLTYAMKKLLITESGDTYVITINKNLKYKNYNLDSLVKFITYGNREFKGYNIMYIIFKHIQENINMIYKNWKYNIY